MISTGPAKSAHKRIIAAGMREQERLECAALGYTPRAAVDCSLGSARQAWTGFAAGVPVCMFGVSRPADPNKRSGEPWLLSTDALLPHRRAFLRLNRSYLQLMLGYYPHLTGMVFEGNTVAVRWLRWLGFAVGSPIAYGIKGERFRPFEITQW